MRRSCLPINFICGFNIDQMSQTKINLRNSVTGLLWLFTESIMNNQFQGLEQVKAKTILFWNAKLNIQSKMFTINKRNYNYINQSKTNCKRHDYKSQRQYPKLPG